MDIVLSNLLVQSAPNVPLLLQQILERENETRAFSLAVAPPFLEGYKTIRWRLRDQTTPRDDPARSIAILWLDHWDCPSNQDKIVQLAEDFRDAHRSSSKGFIFLVGWSAPMSVDTDVKIALRTRSECLSFDNAKEALEEVFRFSIALNPMRVTLREACHFNAKGRALLAALFSIENCTVPQAYKVVKRFRGIGGVKRRLDDIAAGKEVLGPPPENDIDPWLWARISQLFA
ncbi:hypothetical protein V5O48_009551 [Marasmius crinis-equi]|uniref:Uncharacterized protein n=1 Tax=Marasmius crinis-equi TaxID=585013 RepID=A0ABR3FBJ2_9AGAR